MSNFYIRTMNRSDVDVAIGWAEDEGWNPGRRDADPFYATDPSGFLVGELDGKPVASISVVSYGKSFGRAPNIDLDPFRVDRF